MSTTSEHRPDTKEQPKGYWSSPPEESPKGNRRWALRIGAGAAVLATAAGVGFGLGRGGKETAPTAQPPVPATSEAAKPTPQVSTPETKPSSSPTPKEVTSESLRNGDPLKAERSVRSQYLQLVQREINENGYYTQVSNQKTNEGLALYKYSYPELSGKEATGQQIFYAGMYVEAVAMGTVTNPDNSSDRSLFKQGAAWMLASQRYYTDDRDSQLNTTPGTSLKEELQEVEARTQIGRFTDDSVANYDIVIKYSQPYTDKDLDGKQVTFMDIYSKNTYGEFFKSRVVYDEPDAKSVGHGNWLKYSTENIRQIPT